MKGFKWMLRKPLNKISALIFCVFLSAPLVPISAQSSPVSNEAPIKPVFFAHAVQTRLVASDTGENDDLKRGNRPEKKPRGVLRAAVLPLFFAQILKTAHPAGVFCPAAGHIETCLRPHAPPSCQLY